MSNEFDMLRAQVAALQARVSALERNVEPLLSLEGVDGAFLSDQAIVGLVAESLGSRLAIVCGESRCRDDAHARKRVVQLLHQRANWAPSRIARSVGRSKQWVCRLILAQNRG